MKKNGNTSSNLRYNPRSQKPNLPIDSDELDGAMERFIREKYQHKTLSGEGRPLPSIQHHTGSSSSSNDIPPPLPPKSNPLLGAGLRSQSSTYPTSQAPLPSPPTSEWSSGGSRNGDTMRMAGIPENGTNARRRSLDIKLNTLRDMGFFNESKNATVLKGVSGDLDRAVDSLNRLGEGYGNVLPRTRPVAETNGLSFEKPSEPPTLQFSPQQTGQSQSSNASNPFFRQQQSQSSQPQSMQPQPPSQTQQPLEHHHQQPQSAPSLIQSFGNMNISQDTSSRNLTQPHPQAQPQDQSQPQPQPLFPNNTGSWVTNLQPQLQTNPFLKTWTPPMTPSPYQYTSTPIPTQPESNPFLRSAQLQALAAANHLGPGAQQMHAQQQLQQQHHQFAGVAQRSASLPVNNAASTQYQQQAHEFFQVQPQAPVAQSAGLTGTFPQTNGYQQQQLAQEQPNAQTAPYGASQSFQQPYEPQQPQQWQPQQWQQQQQQLPYTNNMQSPPLLSPMSIPPSQPQHHQPRYHDKNSILALYNNPPPQPQPQPQPAQNPPLQNQAQQSQALQDSQPAASPAPPQRSVTMPVSTNPFAAPTPTGHVSRDSVLFTGQGMGGRSASPDAFAGLSARWR